MEMLWEVQSGKYSFYLKSQEKKTFESKVYSAGIVLGEI
jgi:hypothetical protein